VKRVGADLFSRIVRKTPVDTGRARGSWTMATNQAIRSVLPPAPEGTVYPAPAVPLVAVAPGDSVVISNNLPYIGELEDGHSKKAPSGMVKLSIEEVNANMETLVRDGLKDAGL
jgi:hypothetical protein